MPVIPCEKLSRDTILAIFSIARVYNQLPATAWLRMRPRWATKKALLSVRACFFARLDVGWLQSITAHAVCQYPCFVMSANHINLVLIWCSNSGATPKEKYITILMHGCVLGCNIWYYISASGLQLSGNHSITIWHYKHGTIEAVSSYNHGNIMAISRKSRHLSKNQQCSVSFKDL